MVELYIVLAVIFALLIISFAFAYMIFYRVSVRKKPRKPDIKSLFSQSKIDIVGEENMKLSLEWIEKHITGNVCIESIDKLNIINIIIPGILNIATIKIVQIFKGMFIFT